MRIASTSFVLSAVIAMAFAASPAQADFAQDFTGQTLRVDYSHTGTADEEHFALHRMRIEGKWAGSHTQLVDDSNLGKYMVELADLATHRVLYSRGFASIFGEWETTGEAGRGIWRSIEEAVRVPEPRRPVQVRIRKRQDDQSFREVWATTVDPASRFVDRAPRPKRNVIAVLDNGDPARKVDWLILGDGYTQAERGDFERQARELGLALFNYEPFASRKKDFNVWAVFSPSADSGISRPRAGVFRDGPVGARYNSFDSERYVLTLEDRRWRDVAAAAPYDFVLILVNERKYGGGGIYQLYSTAAAQSSYAEYLVVHEFGHHFAGLGDEYFTSDTSYEEFASAMVEPWEPNVTALLDPANLKWGDLIEGDIPLPTPWNKDEYESESVASQNKRRALRAAGAAEEDLEKLFDQERERFGPMLANQEYGGRIGAFEGAMYESRGFYRPATDCIMFTRNESGFCAVCARGIERVIDLYSR